MDDFLLKYYSVLTFTVEILAAITGIILYKKYRHTPVKYFLYFLVYLSIGDFIGHYTHYIANDGFLSFLEGTPFRKNYWWFTLFWKVFAIVFFAFYYYKILKKDTFKNIIKYSGFAFFLFSIVYILLNLDAYFNSSITIISILGAIIIFLSTGLYFVEVLLSDKILAFYKSLNFYMSIIIFIWWLIVTPLVFFESYNNTSDWSFVFLKWKIKLLSNVFMYLTFTFALIFCKPEKEKIGST